MNNGFIIVKNEQEIKRIELSNLLFVKVENYLSTYHLEDQTKFACSIALNTIEDTLPRSFVRINRQCLINLEKVIAIRRFDRVVILSDTSEHEVSLRKMKPLITAFTSQDSAFTIR